MRSMTGYGSGTVQQDGWEVTVDLKTVNHRFLDLSLRLPRNLSFLEQTVRDAVVNKIKRGHTDVFLTVKQAGSSSVSVEYDPDLAVLYCEAATALACKTGLPNDLTVSRLMKMEGVMLVSEKELDQEAVSCACAKAAETAADQVILMRETEGRNLREDLRLHLVMASELRNQIMERAPSVVTEYREKLINRLNTLSPEGIDPQRLVQEVALIADRCAIDEELARLESHIRQMYDYLEADGEIGKKMDFLIQEMNREANTIGSKASDAFITRLVVNLKSEIEKMREQIQNVE